MQRVRRAGVGLVVGAVLVVGIAGGVGATPRARGVVSATTPTAETTHQRFVEVAYRYILRREVGNDTAGFNYWTGLLDRFTYHTVALQMAESHEARTQEVKVLFWWAIRRLPTPAEMNATMQYFASGGHPDVLQAFLVASPEGYQRAGGTPWEYVGTMYNMYLFDPYPTAERQSAWWNWLMKAGDTVGSRYTLARTFATSIGAAPAKVHDVVERECRTAPGSMGPSLQGIWKASGGDDIVLDGQVLAYVDAGTCAWIH